MVVIKRDFAMAAALLILVSSYVLGFGLGNYAPYITMIASLLSAVVLFDRLALRSIANQTWARLFLAGFCLMAYAFIATAAQTGSASSIVSFVPFVLAIPAAFVLSRLQIESGLRLFARICLGGTVLAVLVGLLDILVLGKERAHGLENSPIHFGDLGVIVGFLALSGIYLDAGRRRTVYLLGPVLGVIAALLAGSRGALLVLPALLVVFAVVFFPRWRGQWLRLTGAVAALLVLTALLFVIAHHLGFVRPYEGLLVIADMVQGRAVTETSSSYRTQMYAGGLRAFWDAPLLGHGWKNQVISALPYMSEQARAGYAIEQWSYIHNEPLGFALSAGVLGIFAYLCFMIAPLAAWRLRRFDQGAVRLYLALVLTVGFFVAGMTDVLFMTELPKTIFAIGTGAIAVLGLRREFAD